MKTMIVEVTRAEVVRYRDNGQTVAYVTWRDQRGRTGTTTGDPKNTHMAALLNRPDSRRLLTRSTW